MKYLGIDYGVKKIGVALSDESGVVAFPHSVIVNDDMAVSTIRALAEEKRVGGIVVGDTRTESGAPNEITGVFARFAEALEQATPIKVLTVQEHGTSGAARASLGEETARGEVASPRAKDDVGIDARAAALILQRFLDAQPRA